MRTAALGTRSKEKRASNDKYLNRNPVANKSRSTHSTKALSENFVKWTDSFKTTRAEPNFLDIFFHQHHSAISLQNQWQDVLEHSLRSLGEIKKESNFVQSDYYHKVFDRIIVLYEHRDEFSKKINRDCLSLALYIGALLSQHGILPSRIAKSEEGSIVFDINKGNNFYSFEVFDDREIVFLKDINGAVSAISIDSQHVNEYIIGLMN